MESAFATIVWIGVFLLGPPFLLYWMVRRRRRRTREQQAAAALAKEQAAAQLQEPLAQGAGEQTVEPEQPAGMGFSFPYGVPLVAYPLLLLGITGAGSAWAILGLGALSAVLAVAFARQGLVRANFEEIHAKDPSLNLLTWRINWLLFFALPALVLALLAVARWLAGS